MGKGRFCLIMSVVIIIIGIQVRDGTDRWEKMGWEEHGQSNSGVKGEHHQK